MATRYGTNHFANVRCAERYYAQQGYSVDDVAEMLDDGTIAIGMPPRRVDAKGRVKPRVVGRDSDGRYWIED